MADGVLVDGGYGVVRFDGQVQGGVIAPASSRRRPITVGRQPTLIARQLPFAASGTLKYWMGSTHFLMKTLKHVPTEVSLHVLAYNLKRLMSLLGITEAMMAMRFARA